LPENFSERFDALSASEESCEMLEIIPLVVSTPKYAPVPLSDTLRHACELVLIRGSAFSAASARQPVAANLDPMLRR
jgi:hypothetical protein